MNNKLNKLGCVDPSLRHLYKKQIQEGLYKNFIGLFAKKKKKPEGEPLLSDKLYSEYTKIIKKDFGKDWEVSGIGRNGSSWNILIWNPKNDQEKDLTFTGNRYK